ncbi:MAG: Gfo/Idh/MocA family oxidoreductase [Gemmataceae bacterium]|nr:Gfo/Idh/MocA family oxidoreductase [Gemmataceae bacterium]MDW8264562.1 Gfo/Idh/MocA family oxidoreductase [Gemmataceae bacterium]
MPRPKVHRRDFLKSTAAGATALSLTAASARRVFGANDRLGVAFLGVGGRCQAHLEIILKFSQTGQGAAPVAVCDVWDGNEEVQKGGRGLYPSAKKVGLNPDDKAHVTKDYRRLLDLKEVDVVCVATPDHWHAKMCIDAAAAGKDVFCEKPMTRTIDEAHAVVDAMKKYNRVMTVGVQSMADPRWNRAYELIRAGKIGHVAQGQTSYYRNSNVGQWRYYKLTRDMTPKTIDWDMFLGHAFEVFPGVPLGPKIPFDRAVYGQWRCYWPFGGGVFTDLFVHQTTHLIAAMGVRYPRRVVGAGGIYLEYDERDVPDVATVVADYDEGCQLIITATMINRYPIEEVIRGHLGTIKFMKAGFEIIPDNPVSSPGIPSRLEETIRGEYVDCHPPSGRHADTEALWLDFLKCVRNRDRNTLSTPELGAAAFTTVAMGVLSYRQGQVLFWDKERRKPVPADASWAEAWENRSKKRGKPNQIIGWMAGDTGSLLEPPEYQKLAGPWINGKDPAGG